MKVALVNPPNPSPPPAYFGPPYGLSLLGALLERAGHEVKGYDFDRRSRGEMLAGVPLLLAGSPGLVGISAVSSSRAGVFELSREIKRQSPRTAIVVGGPFATLEPGLVLSRSGADFAAVGDGEETLMELVAALEAGGPVADVPGLVHLRDGRPRFNAARRPFMALDSLPFPAFHLFDAAGELARHRRPDAEALAGPISTAGRRCLAMHSALMVLSSRGCAFSCVFCPMSYSKSGVRRHSVGYFLSMVEDLVRSFGQRHFVFGDNFFTLDKSRVHAICDGLISKDLGIEWICMTRADAVEPGLLEKMARAGCREISYGVESGSPRVQRLIGKRLRLEKVAPAFEATRKAGISSIMMLMVGNPGDDRRTLRETISLARGIEPDRVLVHTTKIYPGTRLNDIAIKRGAVRRDLYATSDEPNPPAYTGELDAEELKDLRAMIEPRTSYLSMGAGCPNGCCGHRRREETGVSRPLSLASLRAERVVLGGGDALLGKDLRKVFETARVLDMHGIWLYTTARPLAREQSHEVLRGQEALRGIVVPLFSPEEREHDARVKVPGALLETRLGLLRWKRTGGGTTAWAFLDRRNVRRLPTWLDWMAEHGVAKALFLFHGSPPGWGSVPVSDLPSMSAAAAALMDAIPKARRSGVAVSVFGLPECLLPDEALPQHELRASFDEEILPSGEPEKLTLRRQRMLKSMTPACAGCPRGSLCEGIWRDYLERRGDSEFRGR